MEDTRMSILLHDKQTVTETDFVMGISWKAET